MQRIFAVKFSGDSKYVLTGSDDTNIRIWKANAAEQLGIVRSCMFFANIDQLLPRQRAAVDYSSRVKSRFKFATDVKRIDRFRHIPKAIYKAKKLKQVLLTSQQRKFQNRVKNSKKGSVTTVPEKKLHIVAELE
jgi:WD repeat and SOF domain-containing protein 1